MLSTLGMTNARFRARLAAAITALALLLVRVPAAPAGELILRGRVVDGRGFPLTQSRVYLEGSRKATAGVDRDGWYLIKLDVPALEQLAKSPVEFTLAAFRRGWALGLESGAGHSLRVEISAFPDSDRVLCYRLRSNDSTVVLSLAGATVLEGQVAGPLQVHFVGELGAPVTVEEKLIAEHKVRTTGSRPAPGSVVATATAVGGPTSPAPASTKSQPVQPAPATSHPAPAPMAPLLAPVSRAAVPTYAPGCSCRVEGTVELNVARLNEPLDVVVWLESAPRDSQRVHMFMGAPREFALNARGCGSHLLRYAVRTNGRQQFQAVHDVVVDCTDKGLREPRLVLEPAVKRK